MGFLSYEIRKAYKPPFMALLSRWQSNKTHWINLDLKASKTEQAIQDISFRQIEWASIEILKEMSEVWEEEDVQRYHYLLYKWFKMH